MKNDKLVRIAPGLLLQRYYVAKLRAFGVSHVAFCPQSEGKNACAYFRGEGFDGLVMGMSEVRQ